MGENLQITPSGYHQRGDHIWFRTAINLRSLQRRELLFEMISEKELETLTEGKNKNYVSNVNPFGDF